MSDDVNTFEAAPVSRLVWETKYRQAALGSERDASLAGSWRRVASALAQAEPQDRQSWAERFFETMRALRFIPGGRIIAGAGTANDSTLFNCFVMPPPREGELGDSMEQSLLTMGFGGGIGFDASCLAPMGTVRNGREAQGPIAYLAKLDRLCSARALHGTRRGARMASLRCDHPDILAFVNAKTRAGELPNFNLSVQITDDFMAAVAEDGGWSPAMPDPTVGKSGADASPHRTSLPAAAIWAALTAAAARSAEPDLLFVDHINAVNNLWYREKITATNTCGEVPLPAFGGCALGSLNLPSFVREPFTPAARLDFEALVKATGLGLRMLDNTIDCTRYPLVEQRAEAQATRRIGLGIMGLADALVMLGLHYDSSEARQWTAMMMERVRGAAYRSSIALARERGPFPLLHHDAYLAGRFIGTLPDVIRDMIARDGIRNSHLLAIAPTGSISLLAGAVSSGIEPIVAADYTRLLFTGERTVKVPISSYAVRFWRQQNRVKDGAPRAFVAADAASAQDQLEMQATLQRHVDGAISKTVLMPDRTEAADVAAVYCQAYRLRLKGCTVFHRGTIRGTLLQGDRCELPA